MPLITFGLAIKIPLMRKSFLFVAIAMLLIASAAVIPFTNKKTQVKKVYHETSSEALGALQFFNTSNAFPNADIPEDAFQNGYEQYKERFGNASQRMAVTNWQSIGPNNLGGRTLSFAMDP